MTFIQGDAVLGAAVGDAMGVPYEDRERHSFRASTAMIGRGSHNQPAGTWSDDTSMTLATVESLRVCGGFDEDDMRRRFIDWMGKGRYAIDGKVFDVGMTTRTALLRGRGGEGEMSKGNGSLMRILPLAFTDADDGEIVVASGITHASDLCSRSCVTHVHVLRALIDGQGVRSAIERCQRTLPEARLTGVWDLDERDIRSTGYVTDTIEAAYWCAATTRDYRECVLRAVSLGGDTDTISCIAGGMAGIMYGSEGIPDEWIGSLRGKDIILSALGI